MSDRKDLFDSLDDNPSKADLIHTVKVLTNTIVIERHALDAVYATMLAQAEPEELATIEKFYAGVVGFKQMHLMRMVLNAMGGNFDLDLDD